MAKNGSDDGWIFIIICFVVFWPLGLFLLWRKYSQGSLRLPSKKTMSLVGGALAIFGLYRLTRSSDALQCLFYILGGCAIVGAGSLTRMKDRLYNKYRAIIGDDPAAAIDDIARRIPTSFERARRDLERMINKGLLGTQAYIDMSTRTVVMDGKKYRAVESEFVREEPAPKREEAPREESAEGPSEESEFNRRINEIRLLNMKIANETVSEQISKIESLTQSIFAAVRYSPEKRAKINSFMNYYLPTTLKLLTSYSELEGQPYGGKNVSEGKAEIEAILGKLVDLYQELLDQLYSADVLDISSEIQVLETMMAKDSAFSGSSKYSFPNK